MRRALAIAILAASAVVPAVGVVGRGLPLGTLVATSIALLVLPGMVVAGRDRAAAFVGCAVGLSLGPLLALPTYLGVHPLLHIDNPGRAPLDVWIDGIRRMTVPPIPDGQEPPKTRVAVGRRRLAWSPVGAPVGLREIEVEVGPFDDHLYAPGTGGCYWLSATAYGRASTHGIPHGPLPLTEFHRFPKVDIWLADAPHRVYAPRWSRGTVRVALQRWHRCMELAARGCDAAQRAGYVECMRTIDGRNGTRDCDGEAELTCPTAKPAHTPKP